MRYLLSWLLCVFVATQIYAGTSSDNSYRNIWHPMYKGERLAYCSPDGLVCGKKIADAYCRQLGFNHSSQQVIAYNLGLTNFLATREQCKGWLCHGFMTIGCSKGMAHIPPRPYHYTEKRYVYPRYNKHRVDWCYEQGKSCGARAANSFCSRLGYDRAKNFTKENCVASTQTIGSQQLCFGQTCKGFKEITCSR